MIRFFHPKDVPVNKKRTCVKVLLILVIVLYPFINSFLGIDLGDTGLHMFGYENLFENPELLSFTAYLSMLIGWGWLHLFPGLGIWGLNFLEVLIELGMAVAVYRLMKPWLGEITTLIGILLAILAMDTYLNLFNHHQFNVFLLILIMGAQFKAITTGRLRFSVLSGVLFTTIVTARMGSITATVTFFLYLLWMALEDKRLTDVLKHYGCAVAGAAAAAGVFILWMKLFHQLYYFSANILRLFGLMTGEGSSSGGYSMSNLLDGFIIGNLDAIASGGLYFASFFVLLIGLALIFKKAEKAKSRIINILFGVLIVTVALYLLVYAYDVNPILPWPQMTTAPAFIIGVFYVLACLCMVYHLTARDKKHEIVYLCVMAFFLPLLTIAGSNTGTKHVILGLWFIAPVCVYVVKQLLLRTEMMKAVQELFGHVSLAFHKEIWRIAVLVVCAFFLFKFGSMLYYTSNFDSIHRTELVATIHSDKTKWLRTTQREADSVNGVLTEIEKLPDKSERPLVIYGGSILLYSLLEMPAYVQPYFINAVNDNAQTRFDMEHRFEEFGKLPVIVFCRTNNYYGFYKESYAALIHSQQKTDYGGKREILLDFLDWNGYGVQYVNDYYCVLYPYDILVGEWEDYRPYILGNS